MLNQVNSDSSAMRPSPGFSVSESSVTFPLESRTKPMMDTLFSIAQRSPVLFYSAIGYFVLAVLFLGLMPFETRQVMGINLWIKPLKFAISIGIFLGTLAWLLPYFRFSAPAESRYVWLTWVLFAIETVILTVQASRGVQSHFNITSPVNALMFNVMGIAITINTILVGYLAWKAFQDNLSLPAGFLWGLRLGLLLFVVASLEGFVMASQLAHSVGVPDGGPGLPLVNWSTRGGDLRIAHFIGLHGLQALPLIGILCDRFFPNSISGLAGKVTILASLGYWVVALGLFALAMFGIPLIRR